MRPAALALVVAMLAACGDAEPAADVQTMPPGPTLADFAGTWDVTATLEGVPDPVPSTMSGSAAGDDWTMTLEGRPGIPVQVTVQGDSLIAQTAEYESVLRPGVMVSVRTASVLEGGMLMGNLEATYRTAAGEERVAGSTHGMRAPR